MQRTTRTCAVEAPRPQRRTTRQGAPLPLRAASTPCRPLHRCATLPAVDTDFLLQAGFTAAALRRYQLLSFVFPRRRSVRVQRHVDTSWVNWPQRRRIRFTLHPCFKSLQQLLWL